MSLKRRLFVFLLLGLLLRDMIASQQTCGASYKGELFEDFHGGHSYVSYDIDPRYMNEDSLIYQDRFCTKNNGEGTAVIARLTSMKNHEDIVLEIINGQVGIQLIHDDEAKPECLHMLNSSIYDDSNYKIQMHIEGPRLSFGLFRRDASISRLTLPNIGTCLRSNLSTFLYLERGGMHADNALLHGMVRLREEHLGKPHLYGNFDGCMGDSMINGVPLVKAAHEDERSDVDPSCDDTFGPDCTSACATTYIYVKGNKCLCPAESEINDVGLCSRSCNCFTCQNGGTCVAASGSDAQCSCTSGYKGRKCEEKVDPCVDVVCRNGGTCSVLPSGTSCICPPGFTGSRCEVALPGDPCREVPCQNNGTCERNATDEETFVCSCLAQFYGKFCENQKTGTAEMPPWKVIALPVIFSVVVVGVIIGITIHLYKKRTRKSESDPNSEQEKTSAPDSA